MLWQRTPFPKIHVVVKSSNKKILGFSLRSLWKAIGRKRKTLMNPHIIQPQWVKISWNRTIFLLRAIHKWHHHLSGEGEKSPTKKSKEINLFQYSQNVGLRVSYSAMSKTERHLFLSQTERHFEGTNEIIIFFNKDFSVTKFKIPTSQWCVF